MNEQPPPMRGTGSALANPPTVGEISSCKKPVDKDSIIDEEKDEDNSEI